MTTPNDTLLAQLAVRRGFTTEERVRECLALQERNRAIGYDEDLGAVLAKKGYLSDADFEALQRDLKLAAFVRFEQLFARLCVDRGLFAADRGRTLLEQQRNAGYRTRLGDVLIERGVIDKPTRDAMSREVIRRQDEAEQRVWKEPNAAPPPATTQSTDVAVEEVTSEIDVSRRALADLSRDVRRFSTSGSFKVPFEPHSVEGFQLEDRLGQGALGVVYRARPATGGGAVALKVLSPALVSDQRLTARFRSAWDKAVQINHPGVIKLGALGRSGQNVYFTAALVEGDSLADVVERGGPLPSDRVSAIARSIAETLAHCHQRGVVHSGLSPGNIFLRRGDGAALLGDLGVAGITTSLGGGTARYASPEVLEGKTQPAPSDDFYGLGCAVFFALVGRPPFADDSTRASSAPDPRADDPGVAATLANFVASATNPDPLGRLADAGAVVTLLGGTAASPALPAALAGTSSGALSVSSSAAGGLSPFALTQSAEHGTRLPPTPSQAAIPVARPFDPDATVPIPVPAGLGSTPGYDPNATVPIPRPALGGAGALGLGKGAVLVNQAVGGVAANDRTQPMKPLDFSRGPPVAFSAGGATMPIQRPDFSRPPPGQTPSGFDANDRTQPMKPMAPVEGDLTGQTIHNRYKIEHQIGQGGMGVVYRAEHTLMGRTVAFKVLNSSLVRDDESIARFKREIMAMAQFHHPNVVRIFDAGTTKSGQFYMALEFVEGDELADVLKRDVVPLERAQAILTQILAGVSEGHKRGIVHRDLKAENIMLTTSERGEEVVKVMDFGIAKILSTGDETQVAGEDDGQKFRTMERTAVGTPEYMSPEQASGSKEIDHRSDLYSLGVVAYELLTGKLPFEADTPVGYIGKHIVDEPRSFTEVAAERQIPPALETYVMKALEKDPDDRYQSAGEMLEALEAACANPDATPEVDATVFLPGPSPEQPPQHPLPPEPGPSDPTAGGGAGKALVAAGFLAFVLVVAGGFGYVASLPTVEEQLTAARPALTQALKDRRYSEARTLLSEIKDGASDESDKDRVDRQLGAIEVARAFGEGRARWTEEGVAFQQALGAGDIEVAQRAFAAMEPLALQLDELREALEHQELGELVAGAESSYAIVLAERRATLEPLQQAERVSEALAAARAELAAENVDHDVVLRGLEDLEAMETLSADQCERVAQLMDEIKATKLEVAARAELAQEEPDFAAALASVQEAVRLNPTEALRELMAQVEASQGEASRDSATREVEAKLADARSLVAQGRFDAAGRRLKDAERALRVSGAEDRWDLPERAAELKRWRETYQDYLALPEVRADSDEREIDAAIAARRSYLERKPGGFHSAELPDEIVALEAQRNLLADSALQVVVRAQVEKAEQALLAGNADLAKFEADKAAKALTGAGHGTEQVDELLTRIERRRALLRQLKRNFVELTEGVYISRTEATNTEYRNFVRKSIQDAAGDADALAAARGRWPAGWAGSGDARVFASGQGNFPVGGVSFQDAVAYCRWFGARLGAPVRVPTEAEWLLGATKGDGRAFPWGEHWDPSAVNFQAQTAQEVSGGTIAGKGKSPFGLYHMAGNVAEWVDTPWFDEEEGEDASARILKGGSYKSFAQDGLTVTAKAKGGLTERQPEWGFRILVDFAE